MAGERSDTMAGQSWFKLKKRKGGVMCGQLYGGKGHK